MGPVCHHDAALLPLMNLFAQKSECAAGSFQPPFPLLSTLLNYSAAQWIGRGNFYCHERLFNSGGRPLNFRPIVSQRATAYSGNFLETPSSLKIHNFCVLVRFLMLQMEDSLTRIYILARAEFSTAFESWLASGGGGRKDDSHCKYHGDAHNVSHSAAVCALSAFSLLPGIYWSGAKLRTVM